MDPSPELLPPLETPLERHRQTATAYRGFRLGSLEEAQRSAWQASALPVLKSLRVFHSGIYLAAAGQRRERHGHPEGVLIYCTDGQGFYHSDGQSFAVTAGDLLYCPRNSAHSYGADTEHPWSIYWMHLSGHDLDSYERLARLLGPRPVRTIGVREELIAAFERLVSHFRAPYDDAVWLAIQSEALGILAAISLTPASMESIPQQTLVIQKIMARMDASLERPFELGEYAEQAGYHPSHFIRLFRQVTGDSPGAYFSKRKMQRACELLSHPGTSVHEVSLQLGFANPYYFSNAFKKVFGLAPSHYQQRRIDRDYFTVTT